ncbi:MAG: hypothetical protein K8S54_06065 [Spirochaetia bacterium]|nr:hypothetical protein [Spirochaetia bacterium]
MEELLQEVSDLQTLKEGDILRRQSPTRKQQGVFVKHNPEGGLILCDVVDLLECTFAAEAAVIRPLPEDKILLATGPFDDGKRSQEATQIVLNWSLFREHPEHQKAILQFIKSVYFPIQIIELNKAGNMREVFVPVQQKFKIGKFKEKIDWEKIRDEKFVAAIEALAEGAHMTYVAFIPGEQNHKPLFYTIGTKPHQETIVALNREQFAFKPTHAGHIKILSEGTDKKRFIADAGSNFLGAGIHTSLPTAEMVTEALKELFPNYEFQAIAGRGAFGIQQSY